jgi:hypothetical protein
MDCDMIFMVQVRLLLKDLISMKYRNHKSNHPNEESGLRRLVEVNPLLIPKEINALKLLLKF